MEPLIRPRRSLLDGAQVLVLSLGLYFVGAYLVTPRWMRLLGPWVDALPLGPRRLAGHVLLWSLMTTVVCGLGISVLVRTGRFMPLSLTREPRRAIVDGLILGAVTVATMIFCALLLRLPIHLHFDGWQAAGNIVSNAYEELIYRGLIFTAGWYATRSVLAGALVSGLVFGLSHSQYPLPIQLSTAAAGMIWSWGYARTGNFLAPYLAHEVADLILDTLL